MTEGGVRPQTARARISHPVSGGQCHLIHLTILDQFSLHVHKGGLNPIHFILFTLMSKDEVIISQSETQTSAEISGLFLGPRHTSGTSFMLKAQSHIPSRTSSAQKMTNFGQCAVIRWACVRIR